MSLTNSIQVTERVCTAIADAGLTVDSLIDDIKAVIDACLQSALDDGLLTKSGYWHDNDHVVIYPNDTIREITINIKLKL